MAGDAEFKILTVRVRIPPVAKCQQSLKGEKCCSHTLLGNPVFASSGNLARSLDVNISKGITKSHSVNLDDAIFSLM